MKMTPEMLAIEYNQGLSVRDLAKVNGLSYSWTRRKIVQGGATLRKRSAPKKPCPISIDQLAQEYRAGSSIRTLAERYKLYYKRVRELLLEHGVQLRPPT